MTGRGLLVGLPGALDHKRRNASENLLLIGPKYHIAASRCLVFISFMGVSGWNLFAALALPPRLQKIGGYHAMRLLSALLFITLMNTPTFAYTAEQVSACMPDVMRLCSASLPDEGRVTSCMVQKKKQISTACLQAFNAAPATPRVAAR